MKRALLLLVSLYAVSAYGRGISYVTINYQSYNPATGNFDLTQAIQYQLPDPTTFGAGPYPVFIYIPGTYEPYNDPLAAMFMNQMALRGFLAASVQYMNTETNQTCTEYTARAQGIYDATRATSAVGALCSAAKSDCNKGITTSGISQGAELALQSADFAPQVKAVFALSAGDQFINVLPIPFKLPCEDKVNTNIPANRLTVIDGISDPYFGGQSNIQGVSGLTCPNGTFQCWSPDGSGAGWYIVQDWQNAIGFAGHCYFFDGNTQPYSCGGTPDPNWKPGATYNWSLGTNLDWLATFGTHRNFSPTGY
ncbi:MAG: hypothetical protein C5B51_03780 [Terriglobia bacterium]|nr:MAG: hypothetical protein C5B51_03780 [Terriglobia bacterium]